MREFKFRVWSEDRKMFVMDGMSIDHIQKDAAESLELPIIIATEKCAWQQYTGLKDKNGKDIYEGDVLAIHNYQLNDFKTGYHTPLTGVVIWDEADGGFTVVTKIRRRFSDFESLTQFEVIGHTYEYSYHWQGLGWQKNVSRTFKKRS